MTILLDPTSERTVASRQRAARPASLLGKRVGLLDIGKPRGDVFLDRVEERLRAAGVLTSRFVKPTYAKPAPTELRQQIAAQCDVLIEALAD